MDHELTLFGCWRAAKCHWRVVICTPLVCMLLAGALSLFVLPRDYEAKATVLIPQGASRSSRFMALAGNLAVPLAGMGISAPASTMETYKVILESRQIREAILAELDLKRIFQKQAKDEALRELRDVTRISVDPKSRTLAVTVIGKGPARLSRRAPWRADTQQAKQLAADVANAYMAQLDHYLATNIVFQAQRNRKFLAEQKDKAEEDLREAEVALLSYQTKRGIASLPDETQALVAHHAELEAQRAGAELEVAETSQRMELLKSRLLAQAKAGVTEAFPDTQPLVEESRKRLAELEVQLAVKSESLAPSNPEVRELTSQIEETRSRLKQELADVYTTAEEGLVSKLIDVEVQWAAAKAKTEGLQRAVKASRGRLVQLPAEQVGFARLQRELEVRQEVYKLLCTEYARAEIEESKEVIRFDTLDAAEPPLRHARPSFVRNSALAMAVGLMLAILVVLGLESEARPRPAEEAGENTGQ